MGKSLKINFIFNLLNTLVGLFFPLITFPYISRVILPEGIGQVQFFQSIINYIALVVALGIPLYAVKEVAKVKDSSDDRDRTTVEILLLHSVLTLLGCIAALVIAFCYDKVAENRILYLILSTHLIFAVIGVEWFYQGIEEFKYITIRSLIVRIATLLLLFTVVKDQDDLKLYGVVVVAGEVGNYLFNFIHLFKYLNLKKIDRSKINLKRHIKPALKIFTLNIIVSVYVYLDSIMLGAMCSNESVGYYSATVRLTRALSGIAGALGGVLLPRLSSYVNQGAMGQFSTTARKSVSLIFSFTCPMTVGLILCAPPIIAIFCGAAFYPAIITLQIIAPVLIFLGISSLIGTRILYSQDCERIVIICTALGAIINFCLNYLLIPVYSENGAAFASVVAEGTVAVSMLVFGRKYIPFNIIDKQNILTVIASLIMGVILVFVSNIQTSDINLLLLELSIGCIVYFAFQIIFKNEFFQMILRKRK